MSLGVLLIIWTTLSTTLSISGRTMVNEKPTQIGPFDDKVTCEAAAEQMKKDGHEFKYECVSQYKGLVK